MPEFATIRRSSRRLLRHEAVRPVAVGLEDISEVADKSVGHVVESDDIWSLEFDHGELLLGQRRHDASVATEKNDVVLNDAEKIKNKQSKPRNLSAADNFR